MRDKRAVHCLLALAAAGPLTPGANGLVALPPRPSAPHENPDFPSDHSQVYAFDDKGKVRKLLGRAIQRHGFNSSGQEELNISGLLDQEPDGRDGWRSRLLVVPEKKFAFCYIDKNACTQFNLMMNGLNGIFDGQPWYRSWWAVQGVSFNDVTRKKGWFRAVFLREPTERLLSAHRSKCESHDGYVEDHGDRCEGRIVPDDAPLKERVYNFRDSLRLLRAKKAAAGGDLRFPLNAHYEPMRHFCGGLYPDLHGMDYVGSVSAGFGRVRLQVREMLDRANLTWGDRVAELFPAEPTLLHDYAEDSNGGATHVTDTRGTYEDYYSMSLDGKERPQEWAEELYAMDYELRTVEQMRYPRVLKRL